MSSTSLLFAHMADGSAVNSEILEEASGQYGGLPIYFQRGDTRALPYPLFKALLRDSYPLSKALLKVFKQFLFSSEGSNDSVLQFSENHHRVKGILCFKGLSKGFLSLKGYLLCLKD